MPGRHNYLTPVLQLLNPMSLEPVLRNKRNHRNEKPMYTMKNSPQPPQLEKGCTKQGGSTTTIIIIIIKKKKEW